jgi:hypothetical protein
MEQYSILNGLIEGWNLITLDRSKKKGSFYIAQMQRHIIYDEIQDDIIPTRKYKKEQ